MDIILVRHGETYDNVNKVFSNKNTSHTEKGKLEIENTKRLLDNLDYEKVYYSPLTRGKETLDLLSLQGTETSTLEEYDFGIFTGKTYKEIDIEFPENARDWVKDPFGYKIPEGDRLKDRYVELKDFLDRLVEEDEDVVLVTHAGVIQLACCWIFDDISLYYRFKVDNGSISIIRIDEGYKYLYKLNWI